MSPSLWDILFKGQDSGVKWIKNPPHASGWSFTSHVNKTWNIADNIRTFQYGWSFPTVIYRLWLHEGNKWASGSLWPIRGWVVTFLQPLSTGGSDILPKQSFSVWKNNTWHGDWKETKYFRTFFSLYWSPIFLTCVNLPLFSCIRGPVQRKYLFLPSCIF